MLAEPLHILFQDDYLVAIHKPAGHLVHPADKPQPEDLVAMKILRDQLGKRVNPIHRLDRPTCGILLFGLEPIASRAMHQAFENQEAKKTYWAVIEGQPPLTQWCNTESLRKEPDQPLQQAKTEFLVLNHKTIQGIPLTLLECTPATGRFHQIRRHLSQSEMPILGDYRYAGIDTSNRLSDTLNTQTRMMLQAKKLSFEHPITKEHLIIESPLDPIFPITCE